VKIISLYRRRGRDAIGLKCNKLKKTINKTVNKAIKNRKRWICIEIVYVELVIFSGRWYDLFILL